MTDFLMYELEISDETRNYTQAVSIYRIYMLPWASIH